MIKQYPLTQLPMALTLVVYDNFEQVQTRWRAAQHSDIFGFQSYEWLCAWQTHLGQHQGWEPTLVEVQDAQERTVMLFPLGVRPEKIGRVLSFLGGEVTDYHAPIVDPAFLALLNKETFTALWAEIVAVIPDVDIVRFKRVPTHCGKVLNPMVWLDGMMATEQAHAAKLTPTFEEFQSTRSAKMFADTRRQARRLAESGDMRLLVHVPKEERAAAVSAMARQKSRRWKETGSRDLFAEEGYLSFYQHLAAHGIVNGEVVVSGLQLNGQWIATHWGIRYGTRFYWLMPGYEAERWARYSPGRVLLDAVVQWSIDAQLTVFDLTVGDEGYKRQWTDQVLPLYAGIYGVSTRGKIVVALYKTYRWCYTRAKESTWLRAIVKRVRAYSFANNQSPPSP